MVETLRSARGCAKVGTTQAHGRTPPKGDATRQVGRKS
jgi:hypothetical protein